MNSNNDQISNLLGIILIIMLVILAVLVIALFVVRAKIKRTQRKREGEIIAGTSSSSSKTTKANTNTNASYNKQSIFDFMEFDKIEDNMIVKKKGSKYLMVIECQGINYDLMSELEKNSVEQGFIQFLNTLRYPIQIYIQTRTVNLESGIIKYKERVKDIRNRMMNKQMELNRMQNANYGEQQLQDMRLELIREQNLYEYGVDIIQNTEKMSKNNNILRKHYYIIISYMPEQLNENYAPEEITGMAFSELYTKAQTIISALSVSEVAGKILDSNELAELLYIAYNRDESELYNLNKSLEVEFDELYSTAPDVFEKRIKALDKRIKEEANIRANEAIQEVLIENEQEREAKRKEKEMDDLIKQMAEIILSENERIIGKDIADKAKTKVRTRKTKPKEAKQ